MSEEKVRVMTYSGYRGEETPRVILHHDKRIEVIDILSRWVEEGIGDRATKRFFRVKGSDGGIHLVFHDEKTAEWYYNQ